MWILLKTQCTDITLITTLCNFQNAMPGLRTRIMGYQDSKVGDNTSNETRSSDIRQKVAPKIDDSV